ncbi:Brefeldin A-inhibited guanine nucleotide-exchange protein 3 [Lamellibrachia satsuma]|nr:Brefeldin A-inhibited guanine nucleotide-exchange protein 3 [Lamellibrachia satsuma]
MEFVMVNLKTLCKQFKLDTNLSIIYADDATNVFTMFEKLQLSTEELQAACRKCGECDADDNDDSDSGSDVMEVTAESLCLPALGYLQHCCSILASMWSMPSCPVISDADRIRTTVSPYCVDPDILNFDMSAYRAAFGVMAPPTAPPEWAPHGQAPHSQRNGTTQRGEDRATKNTHWNEDVSPEGSDDGSELGYRVTPLGQLDKPTGVLRVWFLVLEGLTNTVSACTRNYQPQILQTLFELLRSTAELPGAAFALYCVNHLLLPKLQQWLRHGNQITNYWHSGSLANFKQYCGLCTDLVVEFILQFTAMAEEELAVEFMLKQLLDVLVECVAQATESLSRLGCSCIRHCVLSCGPELTEAMWYIAMCGIKSACHVSVNSLQQLMTPFLPNSDNFYGDIGHVKVAVRKDQSEAGCDRLCHLAHQVFLLESQQGGRSPLDKALDENQSYVFLIYPPTESDTGPDNRLTRVSFSSVVVGLISHQLLMQTVATLLLHGTSNTVTCRAQRHNSSTTYWGTGGLWRRQWHVMELTS